jgi:hypothetical protein
LGHGVAVRANRGPYTSSNRVVEFDKRALAVYSCYLLFVQNSSVLGLLYSFNLLHLLLLLTYQLRSMESLLLQVQLLVELHLLGQLMLLHLALQNVLVVVFDLSLC